MGSIKFGAIGGGVYHNLLQGELAFERFESVVLFRIRLQNLHKGPGEEHHYNIQHGTQRVRIISQSSSLAALQNQTKGQTRSKVGREVCNSQWSRKDQR